MAVYPYQGNLAALPEFQTWEYVTAGTAFATTGDKAVFRPVVPVTVFRWGIINLGAAATWGSAAAIALDWRPTAGVDTNRVEVGTITASADIAVGTGLYSEFGAAQIGGTLPAATTGADGSILHAALSGSWGDNTVKGAPVRVNPGEELVFECTNAFDAFALSMVFLHYVFDPFVAGDGETASRIVRMTKKAS